MKLVIWHYDRYPTSPGVYLGHFPGMGHELTWVECSTGQNLEITERTEAGVRRFTVMRKGDSTAWKPIALILNRWRKWRGFLLKAKLMSKLAAERPDIIQVRELVTEGLLASYFVKKRGLLFVFQYDHPHFEAHLHEMTRAGKQDSAKHFVAGLWIKLRDRVLRSADLLFPISDELGRQIETQLGIPKERMVTFPVGVSMQSVSDQLAEPERLPEGLRTNRPIVCYMGNLSPRRDPARIFEIMEHVLREIPDVQLLLIGERSALVERLICSFSNPDRIFATGFLPHREIAPLMHVAGVGIFPLPLDDPYGIYRTSSPLKVVEYLSAGIPVVASPVPDASRILSESGGGVCVGDEPQAFSAAVCRYLRDPGMAREAGNKGREYIATTRTFGVLADRVNRAYKALLENRSVDSPDPRSHSGKETERWAS